MTELYCGVWLFFIYSFLGWVLEVSFSAVKKGALINRGFLNGAWCPIYGFGAVLIIYLLQPIKNIVLLFLASVVLASLLELLTGGLLEKVYKTKWWDYSDRRFNFKGYICLELSVVWGVCGVLLIKVLNPIILGAVRLIPLVLGACVLGFVCGVFVVDLVITALALNNMLKKAERLDRIAEEIRSVSDELSEVVFEKASELEKIKKEQSEKLKETEKKLRISREKRISELKEKYNRLLEEKKYTHRRLLRAFPDLKSREHQAQLEKLKEKFKIRVRGDKNV